MNRANILYIMSDDYAATAMGAYGSCLAELDPTPNVDRLAKREMGCAMVFCNNLICHPSRPALTITERSRGSGSAPVLTSGNTRSRRGALE